MTEVQEFDLPDTEVRPVEQAVANGSAPAPATVGDPGETAAQEGAIPSGEPVNRFAEAGRLGAQRVHQLIREGKQYEREHGLKPGRQRLRQLIQQGKLYEREHSLSPVGESGHRLRPARMSSDKALLTLFEALVRVAKPSLRARLLRVLQTLESEAPAS